MAGPTSLSTSLRTGTDNGRSGEPAKIMPMTPPMLVPNQSSVRGFSWLSSTSMSAA